MGFVLGLALCLSALVSLCTSLLGVSISLPYVPILESECAFSSIYNLAPDYSLAFDYSSAPKHDSVPKCSSTFIVCDSAGIDTCF